MELYTDYPFIELGDVASKNAPIRKCNLIDYDDDKYCKILIDGKTLEVKKDYLYLTIGRCYEVHSVSREFLMNRVKQ